MAPNPTVIEISPASEPASINEKDGEKGPTQVSTVEVIDMENFATQTTKASGLRKKSGAQAAEHKKQTQVGWDGEEDAIRALGNFYSNILSFSIFTRYVCLILPGALLLGIPLAVFATAAKDAQVGGYRLLGIFVWLEILWVGLWVAKLLAKTLPYAFQFLVGIVSSETRKKTELIRALEIPISLILWTTFAWATVPVIGQFEMQLSPADMVVFEGHTWLWTLRRVCLASIPVSIVYFIEKCFIQMIAVDYHRKQFSAKIVESKRMIGLLTELYSASVALYPVYSDVFEEDDYLIHSSLMASSLTRSLARNTTQRQVKTFGRIARVGNGVTSVFNNIASEVIGTSKIDAGSDRASVIAALEKRVSAEALARRLWMSLAEEGKDALYEEDLIKVLGQNRQVDAEDMFQLLDKDRNGDVSIDEMQMLLADLEAEQKAMVRSMHDVKQSVALLDRILQVAVLLATAIIFAAFFSADFVSKLTILTTSIMSFSFAFAGTVQEFAGSCIFIFSKHPYDVGDRVYINGVEMIVKHISLLYTIFERLDTNRTVQIPNIINNANWVENISRSGAMKESFTINVDAGTSNEDIEALKSELSHFVASAENKRDYQPTILVDVNSVGSFTNLELRIEFTHKSNWSNESLRALRRARFMTALVAALRAIPVYSPGGGDAALGDVSRPSYSVGVSAEAAQAANAQFAADKVKKRAAYRQPGQEKTDNSHLFVGRRGSAVSSIVADPRASIDSRGVRPAYVPQLARRSIAED